MEQTRQREAVRLLDPQRVQPIEVPGGLLARELYRGKDFAVYVSTMGPGQGESWHTHKADVETVYYCVFGLGEISWKTDAGQSAIQIQAGDLVTIDGGIENKTENVGTTPWIIVAIHTAGEGGDILRLRE